MSVDWSNTVNLGQIIVAVISIFTSFAVCLIFVAAIKSDVRSVRESLTHLSTEVAVVKAGLKETTDILRRQDRHEIKIELLEQQIAQLHDELGNRRLMGHVGEAVPRAARRREEGTQE